MKEIFLNFSPKTNSPYRPGFISYHIYETEGCMSIDGYFIFSFKKYKSLKRRITLRSPKTITYEQLEVPVGLTRKSRQAFVRYLLDYEKFFTH